MIGSGTLGLATGPTDPLSTTMLAALDAAAGELGLAIRRSSVPRDLDDVDWVLLAGPPENFPAFLAHRPSPTSIAWFGEPLPRGSTILPSRQRAGAISRVIDGAARRQVLERLRGPLQPLRHVPLPSRLGAIRARAVIARECAANLASAVACAAIVDRIITTSRDRGRVLAQRGVTARVVPYGYHAAFAGPITRADVERDIPVLLVGSQARGGHAPRGLTLARLQDKWGATGPVVADGMWGAERDALVRRAKILLNIGRAPGNFAGVRLLIGLAAGALVVSEPMDDPYPFVPGVHYVEAQPDDMLEVTRRFLADDDARNRIIAEGQAFISNELTMAASLTRVLSA